MNNKSTKVYKGQCLCGSITYEVDKIEPRMGHCHCSMRCKFHGATFATFGQDRCENFRWLSGRELLTDYVADNGTTRQFCRRCGSSMTFSATGSSGEWVEFSLGTLDSDLDVSPDAHTLCWIKSQLD